MDTTAKWVGQEVSPGFCVLQMPDGNTEVWDDGGDFRLFVLPGIASEPEVAAAIHAYKAGFKSGEATGRLKLQHELRRLLDVPAKASS